MPDEKKRPHRGEFAHSLITYAANNFSQAAIARDFLKTSESSVSNLFNGNVSPTGRVVANAAKSVWDANAAEWTRQGWNEQKFRADFLASYHFLEKLDINGIRPDINTPILASIYLFKNNLLDAPREIISDPGPSEPDENRTAFGEAITGEILHSELQQHDDQAGRADTQRADELVGGSPSRLEVSEAETSPDSDSSAKPDGAPSEAAAADTKRSGNVEPKQKENPDPDEPPEENKGDSQEPSFLNALILRAKRHPVWSTAAFGIVLALSALAVVQLSGPAMPPPPSGVIVLDLHRQWADGRVAKDPVVEGTPFALADVVVPTVQWRKGKSPAIVRIYKQVGDRYATQVDRSRILPGTTGLSPIGIGDLVRAPERSFILHIAGCESRECDEAEAEFGEVALPNNIKEAKLQVAIDLTESTWLRYKIPPLTMR